MCRVSETLTEDKEQPQWRLLLTQAWEKADRPSSRRLAPIMGVAQSSLHLVLTGRTVPTLTTMQALARVLTSYPFVEPRDLRAYEDIMAAFKEYQRQHRRKAGAAAPAPPQDSLALALAVREGLAEVAEAIRGLRALRD